MIYPSAAELLYLGWLNLLLLPVLLTNYPHLSGSKLEELGSYFAKEWLHLLARPFRHLGSIRARHPLRPPSLRAATKASNAAGWPSRWNSSRKSSFAGPAHSE